jgi:phenylpyruvate tautomerase PptA (4-oxalocrotonate tautomerase family)
MPIVTVTLRKPKTKEFKARLLKTIHAALVEIGVDANDRFQRVIELDDVDFQFDDSFPDVRTRRTDSFVLIEILLGVGRSVKVKKHVINRIVERLSAHGMDPENLMIIVQEVPWENWSPAGGRTPEA